MYNVFVTSGFYTWIFLSMNGAYAFQKLTRIISKGNNLLIYKLRDYICSALFLALTLLCFFLFGLRSTMKLYHCGNLLTNRNGDRQTFVGIRMHFRDRLRGFAILEICSLNLNILMLLLYLGEHPYEYEKLVHI